MRPIRECGDDLTPIESWSDRSQNCLHDVCIVGKTKIRDGGIQFEVPQDRELPQRLDAVLEAIYAAFGIG